ncbi:hypothetical protein PENSPDRAFT_695454 [Peniophora sp. CONT]|nr:hypothetical protein PENSPDRAFT_695454 [Peniophora sp. CONT]
MSEARAKKPRPPRSTGKRKRADEDESQDGLDRASGAEKAMRTKLRDAQMSMTALESHWKDQLAQFTLECTSTDDWDSLLASDLGDSPSSPELDNDKDLLQLQKTLMYRVITYAKGQRLQYIKDRSSLQSAKDSWERRALKAERMATSLDAKVAKYEVHIFNANQAKDEMLLDNGETPEGRGQRPEYNDCAVAEHTQNQAASKDADLLKAQEETKNLLSSVRSSTKETGLPAAQDNAQGVIGDLRTELATLKEDADGERKRLQQSITEANAKCVEMTQAAKEQRESLQKQQDQLTIERAQMESRLAALRHEVQDAKEDAADARAKLDAHTLNAKATRRETATAALREAHRAKEQAQADLASVKEELQEHYDALAEALEDATSAAHEAKLRKAEAQEARNSLVTAEQDAESRVNGLKTQLLEAERAHAASLLEAERLKDEERTAFAQSKEDAEARARDLQNKLTEAQDSISASSLEAERLKCAWCLHRVVT